MLWAVLRDAAVRSFSLFFPLQDSAGAVRLVKMVSTLFPFSFVPPPSLNPPLTTHHYLFSLSPSPYLSPSPLPPITSLFPLTLLYPSPFHLPPSLPPPPSPSFFPPLSILPSPLPSLSLPHLQGCRWLIQQEGAGPRRPILP